MIRATIDRILCRSPDAFRQPRSSWRIQSGGRDANDYAKSLAAGFGGVGVPNATTEKRGELTTRAMVFSDGDTTVAVVGIDALGFPSSVRRSRAETGASFARENILIGATHTHSRAGLLWVSIAVGRVYR